MINFPKDKGHCEILILELNTCASLNSFAYESQAAAGNVFRYFPVLARQEYWSVLTGKIISSFSQPRLLWKTVYTGVPANLWEYFDFFRAVYFHDQPDAYTHMFKQQQYSIDATDLDLWAKE